MLCKGTHDALPSDVNRELPLRGSIAPIGLRYCIMLAPERRLYGEGAMKTIGLLGGMSWESSAEYYRLVRYPSLKGLGLSLARQPKLPPRQ